jgi:acyl-CoA synthetase (AMP-forming)/AMP-acid ligase II
MIRIADTITKAAWHRGDQPSLTFGDRTFTWAETETRCQGTAAGLHNLGVRPGDRVAWLGLNSHWFFEGYFVPSRIGAILVAVNNRLAVPEMIACVSDCLPKVLIVDDNFIDEAKAVAEACPFIETIIHAGHGPAPDGMLSLEEVLLTDPEPVDFNNLASSDDDTLLIFYTGGTTGQSKGVMLTHTNIFSNTIGGIAAYGFLEGETHMLYGPLFHLAAGARVFWAAFLGAHTIILPKFEVTDLLHLIPQYGVDTIQMVPTMLTMFLEHPEFPNHDLSSIRLITYGASPMPVALMQKAMKLLPNAKFCQGFGMTETSPLLTVMSPEHHALEGPMAGKLKSVGRIVGHVDVRIVDEECNFLATFETGEIVTRGPHVMKGYLNSPEMTAEAMRGGWFHTGDSGYFDDDGFLFLTGRIKDMIISGGENIYPIEIENVLSQHPAVSENAIIGLPDERWGEAVHAVITLIAGAVTTEQEIIGWCRERLAHYKCPRSVTVRNVPMPLSSVNKIMKSELRKQILEESKT